MELIIKAEPVAGAKIVMQGSLLRFDFEDRKPAEVAGVYLIETYRAERLGP